SGLPFALGQRHPLVVDRVEGEHVAHAVLLVCPFRGSTVPTKSGRRDRQNDICGPAYDSARERAQRLGEEKDVRHAVKTATSELTRREREVAGLLAHGLTNREIAERLFIAERTAEHHVEQIRYKLGFHTRSQAAVWAALEETQSHPTAPTPIAPRVSVPTVRQRPIRAWKRAAAV